MNKLWVIGIGPGHEDYILPIAKKKVKAADIVFGGQRHLDAFDTPVEKRKFTLPLVDNIKEMKALLVDKQVAVVLSGDTGFYSMLNMIKREINSDHLETYPGISSLSYMFSRLNLAYDQAYLGSCHGRSLNLDQAKDYKVFAFLTDKRQGPHWLQDKFKGKKGKIHIGVNLSYDNEVIESYELDQALPSDIDKLCVVVIEIEED